MAIRQTDQTLAEYRHTSRTLKAIMDVVCSSFEFAKTLHFFGLFHSLFSLDQDLCCSPTGLLRTLQSDDDWMLVLIKLYKALPSGQRLSTKDPLLPHISKEYVRRELVCPVVVLKNEPDGDASYSSISHLSLSDRLLLASDCCEFLLQDASTLRSMSNFQQLPAMDADSEAAGYQLWTNCPVETSSREQSFFAIAQSALYRVISFKNQQQHETWELIAWDLPTWTAILEKPSGIDSAHPTWLVDLHKSRKMADKQAISRLRDLFEICRPDLEAIQRRILARERKEQEAIRQAYYDQTRRKSSRLQRLQEQAEEDRLKQEAIEAELAQRRAEELIQERLERAKRVGVQLSSDSMRVLSATGVDHQLSRAERVALRNQRIEQAKDDALLEQLEQAAEDDEDLLDVDDSSVVDERVPPVKLVLRIPSVSVPTGSSISSEFVTDSSRDDSSFIGTMDSAPTIDTFKSSSSIQTMDSAPTIDTFESSTIQIMDSAPTIDTFESSTIQTMDESPDTKTLNDAPDMETPNDAQDIETTDALFVSVDSNTSLSVTDDTSSQLKSAPIVSQTTSSSFIDSTSPPMDQSTTEQNTTSMNSMTSLQTESISKSDDRFVPANQEMTPPS